ncbi:MAG: DUF1788 domain-containing protein [Aquidulcibacter sp.]|jgi:hypothetical protein|uniref:DUF1788 domain-containing protein n=1 Tax=Aquidulcibacter sp. TaxID=2052990 RepID=UPI0022C151DA|nr:DUF1788 domain-containing protein [Aquidulcibacter sp.]MCE2892635.1 DUF1788 domain-containing protein [Hyphomonadaceae bacterium]MCZ8207526.1 DUF1788 domain-containing protein [Aquidulcibacter sp.]
MSVNQLQDHLVTVMASTRFLKGEGPGNDVPFFICPYSPESTIDVERMQVRLFEQLEQRGVRVLVLDLYELSLDLLTARGLLDRVLEREGGMPKDQLKELMQSVLDPEDHLVPAIAARLNESRFDILVLTGIGAVFPYIRSHNVLNNLQSVAKDQPTVLFFPGTYAHSLATGASLDLFGRLLDDKFYRAFNILNYGA